MSIRAGALAARTTDKESEKGRVDQTRVKRYWAGKEPEWIRQQQQAEAQAAEGDGVVRTEIAAPVIVRKAQDPRLARLAASRTEDVEETRERHRQVRAAEIVRRRRSPEAEDRPQGGNEDSEDSSSDEAGLPDSQDLPASRAARHAAEEEEEDEEEALKRRQAVKERLLRQQQAAEAAQQQEEEEEEEEETSEYETDSEDEAVGRKLLKPVFVPKTARDTIAEREALEAEEEALREYEKKREEERKLETREFVKLTVQQEEDAAKAAAEEASKGIANYADINTDDDEDETIEFDAWKLRELARIKRMRDEHDRQESAARERERLRNMTDEERRAWEAANPKQEVVKDKKKWRFMQKYWHKGAFFQEAADDARGSQERDSIFDRDYSAPTGEDKFNKEILPAVMQVRNFGRSGRTKWTHLLAEDTTQAEAPLMNASMDRKRHGPVNDFSKPKKFRT